MEIYGRKAFQAEGTVGTKVSRKVNAVKFKAQQGGQCGWSGGNLRNSSRR